MKRALASLLTALLLITLGAGTVTATGTSKTSLRACTNEAKGYFGGIKVFARDKAKGASRVMCPPTEVVSAAAGERTGIVTDRNLNRRNKNRPRLEDIWNGFHRNIESFRLRAAAGCQVVALLGTDQRPFHKRVLDNTRGRVAKTKLYELPGRKDNKTTKVEVWVDCGVPVPVQDQGRIFNTGGSVDMGTDEWSQSITTGKAGQLACIEFQIHTAHPGGVDLDFAVFAGGNPTSGTALFSEGPTISTGREVLFIWDVTDANLIFDVGDVFTFAFSAAQTGVDLAGNDPPGYAGGELYKNGAPLPGSETNDLAFITYVLPGAPGPEATCQGVRLSGAARWAS